MVDAHASKGEGRVANRAAAHAATRRTRIVIALVAVIAVAAAAVLVFMVTRGVGPSTASGGPGSRPSGSPATPGRPAFFFRVESKAPAASGKHAPGAAADASIEIAGRLSTFYDTVFMDPATWSGGVPDDAWDVFDPSVANRARNDAAAFTMGDRAPGLTSLEVSEASLTVKVLLDPKGRPAAAIAEATFVAAGTLEDGRTVDVTNHANLLMQEVDGRWFVFGYPDASTDVETPAPTTPGPTGTGSASTGSATP
jgi:hypothetical protein